MVIFINLYTYKNCFSKKNYYQTSKKIFFLRIKKNINKIKKNSKNNSFLLVQKKIILTSLRLFLYIYKIFFILIF